MKSLLRQAGMSMVELMVAMAIALIGTIIIFQVFEVSEGIRRTTTSGGDAQQNGAIGLYVMENDLRNAGMGFNDTPYVGCDAVAFDSLRAPQNFRLLMVPAFITPGAANTAPDSLAIFYGSQYTVANATTLTAPMASTTVDLKVNPAGRYGYRNGDLLLVVQPATPPVNCELMEVTGLPSSDDISHAATAYTLGPTQGNAGVTSRFNPAGGSVFQFGGTGTAAARVFNIGNPYDATGTYNINGPTTPVHNTYSVVSNQLVVQSRFTNAAPAALADNIVHMRALYGLDDGVNNNTITTNAVYLAGDGIVDRYLDATAFNAIAGADKYKYIAVIKLALVARSANAERPTGGGACDATAAAPVWSGWEFNAESGSAVGGALNLQTRLDLTADANWQCYRYKVFETAIPLRNWIWKSS